jgi:hypothetical protein
MAFTTWNDFLVSFRNALAERNYEHWFYMSIENNREMRTSFTQIPNVIEMQEYLERKASEESNGYSNGGIPFCIGGL